MHRHTMRCARAFLAGSALLLVAGCEKDWQLPGGGSISISPSQPLSGPAGASNGEACIGVDERGRPHLLARERCVVDRDGDGVIRAR